MSEEKKDFDVKVHPKYDMYEFNTNGQYRMIGKKDWLDGYNGENRYNQCLIKGKNDKKQTTLSIHRAVWETFKGPIEEKKEIDHIDNNKKNNRLDNLQCITMNENRKKRNHDFLNDVRKDHGKKQKTIKGINKNTKEEHIFKNKSQAGKYYGCSPALVYLICEKKQRCNSFGGNITFEYTEEKIDTIIENKRKGQKYAKKNKLSEEEKKERQKLAMKKYHEKKRMQKNNSNIQ